MHTWFVIAHIVGVLLFVAAHGVSMGASLMLRGQRDRGRATTLLQLSMASNGIMYLGLLLLLAGGIAAGFSGSFWGALWLWVAIGVLVVVMAAMYAMASPHYGRLRAALGLAARGDPRAARAGTLTDAQIDVLIDSPLPYWLGLIGGIGLVVIVWLMVAKPF